MRSTANNGAKQLPHPDSLKCLIIFILITVLGNYVGGAHIRGQAHSNGTLPDIEQLTDNLQYSEGTDEVTALGVEIKEMRHQLTFREIKIDKALGRIEEQINRSLLLGLDHRNFVEEKLSQVMSEFQRSLLDKTEMLQLQRTYSKESGHSNLAPESQPNPSSIKLNVTKTDEVTPLTKKLNGFMVNLGMLQNELNISDLRIQNLTENGRLQQDKAELKDHINDIQRAVAWLNNLNFGTATFTSALFVAAYEKDYGAVQLLVELGADINAKGDWGESPLHTAGVGLDKTGCLKIIKYLIQKGANAYARENTGNLTFLHNLVADGSTLTPTQFHDIVEYLTSENLLKLFSIPGWANDVTPLMAAVKNIEVEPRTLKVLHKHGVNFGLVDKKGGSLLSYALVGRRSTEILDELIALGVDPMGANKPNQTLFHVAALALNMEGLRYLLKLDLDINGTDIYGNTPLHHLIIHGKGILQETVQVLIGNGADTIIMNGEGRIPLEEAELNQAILDKDEVLELLRRHDPNLDNYVV